MIDFYKNTSLYVNKEVVREEAYAHERLEMERRIESDLKSKVETLRANQQEYFEIIKYCESMIPKEEVEEKILPETKIKEEKSKGKTELEVIIEAFEAKFKVNAYWNKKPTKTFIKFAKEIDKSHLLKGD